MKILMNNRDLSACGYDNIEGCSPLNLRLGSVRTGLVVTNGASPVVPSDILIRVRRQ